MIPEAYMPTPRQRQHRILVRHRQYLRECLTSVRCKIRHILADHNADRKDLFSTSAARLTSSRCPSATPSGSSSGSCGRSSRTLKPSCWPWPRRSRPSRPRHRSGKPRPGRSSRRCRRGDGDRRGDPQRAGRCEPIPHAKAVCAYAGLAPVVKQSGGKRSKDLAISNKDRDCCGGPWWSRPGGW